MAAVAAWDRLRPVVFLDEIDGFEVVLTVNKDDPSRGTAIIRDPKTRATFKVPVTLVNGRWALGNLQGSFQGRIAAEPSR
jgi:hypothetical protein